ncbi:fimbriae-related membrane protein [Burkholderia sp. SFA1]|uniref:type II secretion system F family protein n=1 Tax=unclassified Caballeronia TaxID=2646786 RepID=UPI001F4748CB|nr:MULTISPECIES: type II secretion system F family protein [unclassified Caballeronia]MCE4544115.1 type II secretion system F family protein [Caballeronia sp. PC1]MCE4571266.1 type II secretion system F family protein [Caballeronia sp. CLC5]BBP98818.1 fimbriae-related membrane protein [Burkholderia sp. SFA1]
MTPNNVETLINLLMLLGLLAALAVWWAHKHGGKRGRIAERARMAAATHRFESAAADDGGENTPRTERILRRLARIGDKIPLFDAKYRLKLQKEMIKSGYRSHLAVSILLAVKFFCGLACAAATVMLGSRIPMIGAHPAGRGIAMLMVFIVGMIVPEYVVAFKASRRRKAMAACLPDALDLLVICTNAGNSLGVSIRRVADELKTICPPLSDEFSLAADELKLSGDSTRALNNLAERIDLPSIRALISTLTQSMRYGTPITQALRTLSRTERVAHIVSLEEKAAKLAPKMVVPMMLFILPAIIAIAAGPAVIQLLAFIAGNSK